MAYSTHSPQIKQTQWPAASCFVTCSRRWRYHLLAALSVCFGSKADVKPVSAHVRYVPEADIAANPGTIYWPARMMRIGASRPPRTLDYRGERLLPSHRLGLACILGEEHSFLPDMGRRRLWSAPLLL